MIFEKWKLKEIEDLPEFEVISTDITDHTRWTVVHRRIFKFENKFYQTIFQVGATESQDEQAYEYDDDEIECEEVFPVEKTVIEYVLAKLEKPEFPKPRIIDESERDV